MPLDVIIVGSGIAGLATAIGLLSQGHHVRIYERRNASQFEESGSGIQLQANVNHILEDWGMTEAVKQIALDNLGTDMRDETGSTMGRTSFQGPTHYASRRTYKNLFREVAVRRGAIIHENANVRRIDVEKTTVVFADGSREQADLIIGADGSGSRIRQALFPEYKPAVRNMACFQMTLPWQTVKNDSILRSLTSGLNNTMTMSPGRAIFASPAPYDGVFDVQMIDYEYGFEQDPRPDQFTERIHDLAWLRNRWNDHSPAHRKALEIAQSAFKWRFVEVYGLPSWSSSGGNVALVGDACHAMTPFAGQGTAMVIEDAAVLARLLTTQTSVGDLPGRMEKYEQMRRPRAERVQLLAAAYGVSWCSKDPKYIRARNARIKKQSVETPPRASRGNADASSGSPEFQLWLNEYNVLEEVEVVNREVAKL